MAVDTQVVFPQETIAVNAVTAIEGSDPPAIDITGDDFSAIDNVEINDIEAPAYYVLSQKHMVAALPKHITAGQVRTVTVTSRRLAITERSILRFKISRMPSKASGILRLIQLFVKVLLTRPGSDIFSPNLGGNGLSSVGANFSSSQNGAIISDFVISVQNTVRQITAIQSRQPGIPADEKLLDARVVQSTFSAQEAALLVTVELTSQSGRSALVNVVA